MVLAEKGHIATDAHHWIWPRKRPEPAMNVLTNRDEGRVHLYQQTGIHHTQRLCYYSYSAETNFNRAICLSRFWRQLMIQQCQVTLQKVLVDFLSDQEFLYT